MVYRKRIDLKLPVRFLDTGFAFFRRLLSFKLKTILIKYFAYSFIVICLNPAMLICNNISDESACHPILVSDKNVNFCPAVGLNYQVWHSLYDWARRDQKPSKDEQNEGSIEGEVAQEDDECTSQEEECQVQTACRRRVLLEAKAAFFYPSKAAMRNIYANGIGIYGIELSYQAWRWIYGWVSGSYLSKEGHSIGDNNRTRVILVPVGLGIKLLHSFNCVDLYADLGALYTYFHTKDHSEFVIESTSKWDWGGNAKIGVLFYPVKRLFIDIFTDYSYMKFHINKRDRIDTRHDVNFSGWSVGGGIGWQF